MRIQGFSGSAAEIREAVGQTVLMTGITVEQLSNGIPHIRVEPLIGSGLEWTNDTGETVGPHTLDVSRLSVKLGTGLGFDGNGAIQATGTSGVSSLGGQTGDITLGSGLSMAGLVLTLDSDLSDIAALAGANGLLRKTAGVWSLDTATYLTGNQTITLSGEASGSGATAITVTLANSAVIGKVLTGYTVGANTALAAADTILEAFQKVQGQLNAKANSTHTHAYTDLTYSGLTTGTVLRATGATTAAFGALDLTLTASTSGALRVDRGGTGLASYTVGNYLYASAATTLAQRTPTALMDDVGATRTLTINGTTGEVEVTGGGQTLGANRTWTIGLPADVDITTSLDIGTVTGLTAAPLRVGGDIRSSGIIYATDFVLTGGAGSGTGISLDNLSDVIITSAATGDYLRFNGTDWVDSTIQTSDLGSGTANTTTFLRGDRTWAVASLVGVLDDLTDVTITTVASGNFLRYNGSQWVNTMLVAGDIPSHAHSVLTFNNSGSGGASGSTYDGSAILTVSYNTVGALSSATNSTQSGYFGDIYLFDDSTPSHYLQITNSANLTAAATLSLDVNNASRTISLSGNLTVSAAATISGTNTGDQTITLTGDVTGSGTGSFAATLATVNSNVGSFGAASTIPVITVNGKGLITAVSTATVIAPAGTLTGTTLAAGVTASSLTSVGTLTSLTLSGLLLTTASVAGGAGLRIPHGTAPTAPVNGDVWTTTSGLLVRINGTTQTMTPTSRTITIAGTTNQITSSAGAQDLGSNRTWTLSLPQDIHTAATPTFGGLTINGSIATTAGAITARQAATQDGVTLQGRAGGTSSWAVTITPTTLTASRTLTLADGDTVLVAGTMVPTSRTLQISNGTGITGGGAAVDLSTNRSWTIALTGQALAIHNLGTNGIVARTAADTFTARTITGTAGQITVSNGDGVAGNPTLSLPADVDITTTLDVGSVGAISAATMRVGGDIRSSGIVYATDFVLTGGAGSGTGISLDNLSDVVITAAATGEYLRFNGTDWVDSTIQTSDLGSGTANTTTFLRGDRTWAVASLVGVLDDLTDVTITTVASGQYLRYNGTQWVNTTDGSTLTSLNASNISTGTLDDGRLSSNVPLLNAATNAFTGALTWLSANSTDLNSHGTTSQRQVVPFSSQFQPLNRPSQANYWAGFSFRQNLSNTYVTQLAVGTTGSYTLATRYFDNSTWSAWRLYLNDSNFNDYAPTLTGTGASGTWGISITGSSASTTGNANTATTLQTSRNLWGQAFNGSGDVTGNMTGVGTLDASGNITIASANFVQLLVNQTDSGQVSLGVTSASANAFVNSVGNGAFAGLGTFRVLLEGTERVRFSSNNILFNSDSGDKAIMTQTSDAADNSRVLVGGGGAISTSRGGYIIVAGNEHATTPGQVILVAGSGSNVYVNSAALLPTTGSAFDIGLTGTRWRHGWFSGDLTTATLAASGNISTSAGSITISGGAGRFSATTTDANPLSLTRTGSGNNVTISFTNTDATRYFGMNPSEGFGFGPNSDLSSSPWVTISSASLAFTGQAIGSVGSSTSPTYTFTGDTDTGIYSAGANSIGFATNTVNRATLDGSTFSLAVSQNLSTGHGLAYTHSANQGFLPFVGGGMQLNNTVTVTGAIKIALPTTGTADMLSFWVDIFDYATGESVSIYIAGYNYQAIGLTTWFNTTALVHSKGSISRDYTVRFGDDGSTHCVWIGETNSTWSYLQVAIRDVMVGYTSVTASYLEGWSISTAQTTLGTISQTQTGNLPWAGGLALESSGYHNWFQTTTLTADRTVTLPNANVTLTAGTMVSESGSYADPSWITSLASSKLSGVIPDANISGTYTGLTSLTLSSTLTAALFNATTSETRDKIRVWNSNLYTIGMKNGYTFGGLGGNGTGTPNYAMSFQFSATDERGWWWGDTGHSDAQGAAALTTTGRMTLAHSLRLGYGEADNTLPGATYRLDVSGHANVTGDIVNSGWLTQLANGTVTTPASSPGWYRVATMVGGTPRGVYRIILSTVGGNWTPTTTVIDCFKDWSNTISLNVTKYGTSSQITGVRVVDSSSTYYLEIEVPSDANGKSFSIFVQRQTGHYNTWDSVTTSGALTASGGGTVLKSVVPVSGGGFASDGGAVFGGTVYATDFILTGGAGSGSGISLDNLDDVIITSPATGHFLRYNGTNWVNLANSSVTFNNGGSGGASGSTYNGTGALTVSYNTVGAPSTTGTNATGTWGISITGAAATATSLLGSNGTTVVAATGVTSGVNYLSVTNAITAGPVLLSTAGSDTNIGLTISTKGTGAIIIDTGTGAGQIDLKPGSSNVRIWDDDSSHYYQFVTGNVAANYSITLPAGSVTLVTGTMVPTSRTLTITNGTGITGGGAAVDLSANRSWTIGLTGQALAIHNLGTNGIVARTAASTFAARTITGTTNQVTVTNGDGVSGNPTLSLPQNIHTAATPTFAGLTLTGILVLPASVAGAASLRIPHGTAPTTPTNGDMWTTTAGLYVRINGATVGPLGTGGGGGDVTGPASNTTNAIPIFSGTTGKIIANSTLIFASGAMSGVTTLTATTSVTTPILTQAGAMTIRTTAANDMTFQRNSVTTMTLVANGLQVNSAALGVNVAPNATDGRIDASNDIVAFSSDRRLKTSVLAITNAMAKIMTLTAMTYLWNDVAASVAGFDTERRYVGLFAQEVQAVLPEAVRLAPFDNDGHDNSISGENYLTVQYEKVVPLLVAGQQETYRLVLTVTDRVAQIEERLAELERELATLKAA